VLLACACYLPLRGLDGFGLQGSQPRGRPAVKAPWIMDFRRADAKLAGGLPRTAAAIPRFFAGYCPCGGCPCHPTSLNESFCMTQ
jgi:hypothetical protein